MTTRTTPSTDVDERQTALEAFAQAVRRETHVLAERPELTWQQLHDRLQWADSPLADHLVAERERRSRPGADPWIHNHTRPRESEALIRSLGGHTESVSACAVSPDGTWVVSASSDETLKIWDAATGTERTTLTGHTKSVKACAVSPDGTWIVSASDDRTLKIWDAATGTERTTLTGHTREVNACAVSPDGTWIVSASSDETLKIWDAATGTERTTLTGHTDSVTACAVSPDGTWIVSASWDHTLRIWDAATGTERTTLTGHTELVYACAVSPDGTWIVSASYDHTLRIWDAATGTERTTLTGHTDAVYACAVSPDGAWIVSASWDSTLRIWDAATGTERARLSLPGRATAMALHPSTPMVICGDAGGGMSLAHLVGISLGPFVVTAIERNRELTLRCPACREVFQVERERLGTEATCPLPACGARLRINLFVSHPINLFVSQPLPDRSMQGSGTPPPAPNAPPSPAAPARCGRVR